MGRPSSPRPTRYSARRPTICRCSYEKRGVSQIVLAGMAANLCVESHLGHLLEEGFEIVVVGDATAAPGSPSATPIWPL